MSDDTSDPLRAPSVSVVGLGSTGAETLDTITTAALATLTTVDGPDAAATLLDAADGHASFVVEGAADPAPRRGL